MRPLRMSHAAVIFCFAATFLLSMLALAQTDSGTVSGRVVDPSGYSIVGARVQLVDIDRETTTATVTNSSGLYTFHGVRPGRYRMEVSAKGFKVVNATGLVVNTQANLEQNFALAVGSVSESITVEAKASEISPAVSTVVDRQFVDNLPLNGRSIQSLMQLTPGVIVTPTSETDSGQFSVNGQRATANYFMVDGVSANIGASTNASATQNPGGAVPGLSVLGGSNNLVSVDAVQEFRIQTSGYAPEYGRTPGAQISIETRSGTNEFHGSLFEYLRNDVLDASDWFNGLTNPPLKKSQERQNDFGGVVGGPVFKNKTFFFFSYEGQILRVPRTAISRVPSLTVRQDPATPAAVLPLLNAYPVPNGSPNANDLANELAPFAASFSDQASLHATSLRIDHRIGARLAVFGRYNYSPSELTTRGDGIVLAVNNLTRSRIVTQTLTLGATGSASANTTGDIRFNFSSNRATGRLSLDSFGGAAVPQDQFFFPAPFSARDSDGAFNLFTASSMVVGPLPSFSQKQFNWVASFSVQRGVHSLKFGADYRRLLPTAAQPVYGLGTSFADVPSIVSLTPAFSQVTTGQNVDFRLQNLGAYVQDTWKMTSRMTVTYGLRWDVDFAPETVGPPEFFALVNVGDPTAMAFAPPGTAVYQTRYGNVAPRIGAAYVLSQKQGYETIVKGGFGRFYDLATQQVGDIFADGPVFPFGASRLCPFDPACGGAALSFPLPPSVMQPPPIAYDPTNPANIALIGVDPHLSLPYSLQWNFSVGQALGKKQILNLSYIGAVGRRLIQQEFIRPQNNPTFGLVGIEVVGNHATSDYHSLQLQFIRQLSRGLQVLSSYAWSHSIDTASSSSRLSANLFQQELGPNANRASSDFDVRHSFSAGFTYDVPGLLVNRMSKAITGGWSFDSMIQGRSATPVNVFVNGFGFFGNAFSSLMVVRPDLVPGQPLYLTGTACSALTGACPGGKAFNPAAFVSPPADPATGQPLRQGTLGRNALRGFGAFQWDWSVRRTFTLRESMRLEVKAELFNVLNHPNFANPVGDLTSSSFGQPTTMLNRGLSPQTLGSGGFSPLYQIGGPRSGQLAVKVRF